MIAKKIACFVLSFIICVGVVCSAFGAIAVFVLGDDGYWISCSEKVDYYSRTALKIEQELKVYSIPSGIPETVFDGIVSRDRVKADVLKQIECAKNSVAYSADINAVKEEFFGVFEKYAAENGYELSDELRENLNGLAEICADDYNSHVSLSVFVLIMRYIMSYRKSLLILLAVSAGITVLSLVVLCISQRKKALLYISYAFGGAAILSFVPWMIVYAYKIFSQFYFDPDYMYDYFVKLISGCVDCLSVCSGAFLVLSIVCAVKEWADNK